MFLVCKMDKMCDFINFRLNMLNIVYALLQSHFRLLVPHRQVRKRKNRLYYQNLHSFHKIVPKHCTFIPRKDKVSKRSLASK